jgi:hypothetical protein
MPRLSFREFKALEAQGVRFRPIWETERDEQGMPVRMWLAGWAEMPPRRAPKSPRWPRESSLSTGKTEDGRQGVLWG